MQKLTMSKRVTLDRLISFVTDNCTHNQNDKDTTFDILSNNNLIDKLNYKLLKCGESKNINDLPENLKAIFDPFIKEIKRFGVLHKLKNKDINVSLFFSILFCLDDTFSENTIEEQEYKILKLRDKLLLDLSSKDLFNNFNYKQNGWKNKDLRDAIKDFKNNKMILRYLSDYFNINIMLLNINEDKIYSIYGGEIFNIFKVNIFLVFYEETFEPLIFNEKKQWLYDFEPFKKLINVDKLKILQFDTDFSDNKVIKVFQVGKENLDIYLDQFTKIDDKEIKIPVDDKNDETLISTTNVLPNILYQNSVEEINISNINEKDIFYKNSDKVNNSVIDDLDDELNHLDFYKMNKLEELCKKYNISLYQKGIGKNKKKTKNQLIDELKKIKVSNC
ncbi:Hypothetical protein KVN_LOCUS247 [uncultured virus]|nr:Hypothetical protein KVN_LOCUS247 [uncultured virus]